MLDVDMDAAFCLLIFTSEHFLKGNGPTERKRPVIVPFLCSDRPVDHTS